MRKTTFNVQLVIFQNTATALQERAGTGPAAIEANGPRGPARADVVLKGRGQSAGPRRRLHSSRAWLSREERGRKAPLGDDGDLARRASQHGRAERLFRRCVLAHKRHDLRPEPAAGLHHEGRELHVRALLGWVSLMQKCINIVDLVKSFQMKYSFRNR